MTSSYGTILGASADAPSPDSKSNYSEFEITQKNALADSVNTEIDRQTKEYQAQSRDILSMYDKLHKGDESRVAMLAESLKTGSKLGPKVADYIRAENKVQDYYATIRAGKTDPDVERLNHGEDETRGNQMEGLALGREIDESNGNFEDSYNAKTLFGYTSSYTNDKKNAKNAVDQFLPIYKAEASGFKFRMPDGRSLSLNEATNINDYNYLKAKIDGLFFFEMEKLGYVNGFNKKYILTKMMSDNETETKSWVDAQATASKARVEIENRDDFITDVKEDPQALINFIGTQHPYMGYSWKAARTKAFGYLLDAVKAGDLTHQEVQAILNHQFPGHDFNLKQVKSYWGKEAGILLKASREEEATRYRAKKLENDGMKAGHVQKSFESWKGKQITSDMVQSRINSFKQEFPAQEVPAQYTKALTLSEGGDDDKVKLLEFKKREGLPILEEDVMYINDYDTWKKWAPEVGTSMSEDDTKYRDEYFLTPLIQSVRMEQDLSKGKSPKYKANEWHARRRYNDVYTNTMNLTGNKAEAHSKAQETVAREYREKSETDWAVLPNTPLNRPLANAVQDARKIIKGDVSEFIDNKSFNPGEEVHLRAGLKAIKEGKTVPLYYSQLTGTDGIQMHPRELLEKRLIATGLAKEGDFKPLPERSLNKIQNQRALLSHTTSEGVAYRIANDTDEDVAVILDALSHNPADGYDTIKKSDGTVAVLEKPLSEHTIGEVIELVNQGYDNFGMYDMSARGLLETLQSNSHNLSLEMPFDQQVQDTLVLARMRYKVNRQKQFSGTDAGYRRLVNISPELEQQFNNLMGDIQDQPFMQLKNMLPDVATAYVEENTQ